MTPHPVPSPASRAQHTVAHTYRLIEAQANFFPRSAQVALSGLIANSFLAGTPLIAEAPTGTGKTLAYLTGALAAEKETTTPLVVATATKALQQQLLVNDLPRLFATELVKPSEVVIAKGAGNYLCVRSALGLQAMASSSRSDPEAFLNDSVLKVSESELGTALAAYSGGTWDGDFDTHEGAMSPDTKRALAVSFDTCSRRKCEHFKECAYFRAKAALQGCKLIVTNHDLLLMDLWLVEQGLEPAFAVPSYHLVVDEAHHLPQKAIQVGTTEAALSRLLQSLPKLQGVQRLLAAHPELAALLARDGLSPASFDKAACTFALRDLLFSLMDMPVDSETCIARFPGGVLPAPVCLLIDELMPNLAGLTKNLSTLNQVLRDADGLSPVLTEKARELQNRALDVRKLANDTHLCCGELLTGTEHAKWLFRKENTLSVHCSPLEGAQVLKKLLWGAPRIKGTVMVSATLQDVDGFTRYRKRVGAPAATITEVLPHTFAYEQSELVIADMTNTPKPAERKAFLVELKAKLPASLSASEGSLVLFSSWALLREVAPVLKTKFGPDVVKVQGELTLKLLVQAHKLDIDQGRGSMLIGVATLSEGLDLPGSYCQHVCIVALPFSVPTDPVEQEIAERLGSNYFSERSLPDATQRLTQMVGRLLRRESDRGKVTIFDRRLASTNYGRRMLKALPPFKACVIPQGTC